MLRIFFVWVSLVASRCFGFLVTTARNDLSRGLVGSWMAKNSIDSDSSKQNEWGIPYHDDLPPLGPLSSKPPTKLPNGAQLTLLGSGPGDPDLLTVAAYKLLTTDTENKIIVTDRLVSKEILDLIPKGTEVKVARKLPGCAELAQEELYWWCYQGLNQGKHVIRLKIGDPFVFGRGGEEVLTFRSLGLEATVVPVCITSAMRCFPMLLTQNL